MQTPEEMAREIVEDYDRGALELYDIAALIRARDAEVAEAAKAENKRLQAGIEALADRLEPLACIWQEQGEIELSVPMAEQVRALRALLDPIEGETK